MANPKNDDTAAKRRAAARTDLSLARIKTAAVAKRASKPPPSPSGHWCAAVEVLRNAKEQGK